MNKKEENKSVNAIISLSQEIKGMRQEMNEQLAKVRAGLHEMRTSYMKLDESVNLRIEKLDESINGMRSDLKGYAESNNAIVRNHETRITHLEKNYGTSYTAREPRAEYRVKKKKKK